MKQAADVAIDISSKADTRGFKVAETALQKLNKSVKTLAGTLGIAYGARAIVRFGEASVKAFADDEKAAKSLEIALKNTGNGFATIATEGFISRMQQTYKVLDDQLRPAFQTLLTATSSLTASQQGLELALNISAGTGKDVQTVALALSKAYSGQTTALSKLGAGISAATIKSGDMNKIIGELTSKFQGQALAATKTYAGQMAALGVTSQNVKEIIGKGILDSLAAIGSSDGITKATAEMEKFAQSSADALLGVSTLLGKFKGTAIGGGISSAISSFMNSGYLASVGKKERLKNAPFSATSMYMTTETAERAKLIATIKKGNAIEMAKQKLSKAELDAKNKALADQKNLDDLKKKFDVDRINLETALANSTDEAEKTRIRSLLTIMDEDAAAAGKRLAQLDKANSDRLTLEYLAAVSIGNLGEAARLAALGVSELRMGGVPISQYDKYKDDPMFQKALEIESSQALADSEKALAEANAALAAADLLGQNSDNEAAKLQSFISGLTGGSAGGSMGAAPITIYNDFSGTIGTTEDFTEATKRAMQRLSRYGDSSTFAGAL